MSRGGALALALVDATISEDVERIELLAFQCAEYPQEVISTLVTSLAAALQQNLGTTRARRQIESWQMALMEADR
jgi:hypothetical protein